MRSAWVAGGKVQARDGGDLQAAELDPTVAAVWVWSATGTLRHGRAFDLAVQGGLVGLDDQQIGGGRQAQSCLPCYSR
jgi:hypothetical protein